MGGSRRERRAAAPAAAAAAEEALRRECQEILGVSQGGGADEAIFLAMKLAEKYPKSAAPRNLVGFLVERKAANIEDRMERFPTLDPGRVRLSVDDDDPARIAEDRARISYVEHCDAIASHIATFHKQSAEWYGKAAHLAPRCIFTRVNFARMLGIANQTPQAYKEFMFANRIANPDSPEKNNPWISSAIISYEDQKESAILMASDEFERFLYLSEKHVYNACCQLLVDLRTAQGTPGFKARKDAKELAANFPFSCRANLLGPFLTKLLIDKSQSSTPRIQQYHKVLREVEDCVDMFPSSMVISLFRAELLFAMGHYFEATFECLRGLKIPKPDDPVSQDIPPGSASGSGRAGRIGNITAKLLDLLEQSEERVVDAQEIEKLLQSLCLTPDSDDTEGLVEKPVQDLNKKLLQDKSKAAEGSSISNEQKGQTEGHDNTDAVKGTLSKEKPTKKAVTRKGKLNTDATEADVDKGKAVIRIRQSVLYNNKLEKKKPEEMVRPLQVIGKRTVSKETVDKYAEYCYLRTLCPVKKETCHLCVFVDEKYYSCFYRKGDMIHHCVNKHEVPTIKCELITCDARFISEEDKENHYHYCHVLEKDWWRQW